MPALRPPVSPMGAAKFSNYFGEGLNLSTDHVVIDGVFRENYLGRIPDGDTTKPNGLPSDS